MYFKVMGKGKFDVPFRHNIGLLVNTKNTTKDSRIYVIIINVVMKIKNSSISSNLIKKIYNKIINFSHNSFKKRFLIIYYTFS